MGEQRFECFTAARVQDVRLEILPYRQPENHVPEDGREPKIK